ncbi:MAG: hypothetical protein HGB35_02135, partial [Geobacteraceae bacterium]|nr:hypothetical protein [Geobacteraceae bacterium]
MIEYKNPFEYEQATKLTPQDVVEYYIEDFNYSRFVASKRNVLLVGERGTGKTMTFIYYSLPVQILRASKESKTVDLGLIPVYVPCNTPLIHRREYDLIHPLSASLASEHFMVVSILSHLIDTVFKIPDLATPEEEKLLRLEMEYSLNLQFIPELPLDRDLKLALDKS